MLFDYILDLANTQLFPEMLRGTVPALYTTDDVPYKDKHVPLKFFTSWDTWTWFVIEASPINVRGKVQEAVDDSTADYLFFCLVDGYYERGLGYILLSELLSIKGPHGLRIERDEHWEPTTLSEV